MAFHGLWISFDLAYIEVIFVYIYIYTQVCIMHSFGWASLD